MKDRKFSNWITRFAWLLLILDLLLIAFVPADLEWNNFLALILYSLWLVISLIVISTWFIICYRQFFRTWWGLLSVLLILIISSVFGQGVVSISQSNLALFFTLLFLVSCWAVGVVLAVLLWHRDVAMALIGWGSVIVVWILAFAWRYQGNLIQLAFSTLIQTDQPSPLWWFNPIMCIIGWVVPISIIGFLGHTIRLIANEFSDSPCKENF